MQFDGASTNGLGAFAFSQGSAYRAAGFVDRIRPNDRLTFTARAGVNGGSGNGSVATGLGVHWQPARDVAYDLTGSTGDAGAGVVINGAAFPDPRSLTFDCAHGEAIGSLPAVNAARQRSSSLRASAEKSGKRARIALTAWQQHQQGTPVLTAFDGAAIGLPAGYVPAVDALASSPYVCGLNAAPSTVFTSFTPADQTTRGATVAGTLQMGKALLAGYATVQSRFVTSYAFGTSALAPPGTQVPDVPLHRFGVVASAKLGRAVDALANVSYTAANNPNRLPAYAVFNAGFAAPLRVGTIAIVGSNLTNRFPGPFVSAGDVRTLPRSGLAPLALTAAPLAARAVSVTYTVRAGRLGATGSGAGSADAASAASGEREVSIVLNFRPLPAASPGPEALRIDPDNENCTPIAARVAQPVLDALGVIRDVAERSKTASGYPAALRGAPNKVANVDLEYIPYDGNAHYAVAIGGSLLYSAAVINCAAIVFATPEDVVKRHLYVAPKLEKNGLFIAYSPLVGMYFVPPPQPPKGMTSRSVDRSGTGEGAGGSVRAPNRLPRAIQTGRRCAGRRRGSRARRASRRRSDAGIGLRRDHRPRHRTVDVVRAQSARRIRRDGRDAVPACRRGFTRSLAGRGHRGRTSRLAARVHGAVRFLSDRAPGAAAVVCFSRAVSVTVGRSALNGISREVL